MSLPPKPEMSLAEIHDELKSRPGKLLSEDFQRFISAWRDSGGEGDVLRNLSDDLQIPIEKLLLMRSDFHTKERNPKVDADGFWFIFSKRVQEDQKFLEKYANFWRNFFPSQNAHCPHDGSLTIVSTEAGYLQWAETVNTMSQW